MIDDKLEILKESVVELRRRYELICNMYKSVQVKMFAITGAGFGLLTYLYSDTSANFYFLPDEIYGKILFLLALSLILGSLSKLYIAIRGVYWEYPLHIVKLRDIEKHYTVKEFYTYLRDDYIRAVEIVSQTYSKVFRSLNESSLMLVIGGMLVLLIKVFSI